MTTDHPTPSGAEPAGGRRGDTLLLVGHVAALLAVFGAGAATLIGAAVYLDEHPPKSLPATVLLLLAGFVIVFGMAAPFVAVAMHRLRKRHDGQSRAEMVSIDDAAAHIEGEALRRLVSFNFRLMDRFINVALEQAKAAYLFCAVAACATLLVLLAGTTALLAAETTTSQVTVGLLTAAGATLSGFISVTFMNTFAMTSRQMSYYYGHPLVHCYLLHAEWLAERARRHEGEAARFDDLLIHTTVDAGLTAQQHLLELLTVRPGTRDAGAEPPPAGDGGRTSSDQQHFAGPAEAGQQLRLADVLGGGSPPEASPDHRGDPAATLATNRNGPAS